MYRCIFFSAEKWDVINPNGLEIEYNSWKLLHAEVDVSL